MQTSEFQAIYIMWLRQMKQFVRSRSRVIGTIVQPLFFLFILGYGFSRATLPGMTGDYVPFLAPGIVAMAILFSSMYTGVSVLWDKKFGFLQEILVAPVSRFSIIIGRTLGGATTSVLQGTIVLIIACINFINLTTAKASNRAREVGMRKVVGASRTKIAQQFFGESFLLSIIALIFSILLVEFFIPTFNNLTRTQLTFDLFQNGSITISLLVIVLVVGIISGSYPALLPGGSAGRNPGPS